ncbi:hypothetical protein AvCA_32290 [Azotobacter vinelandii CA]|uniref:Uncharacterized protein n=2 Tax=Azotobacter vinelandii TaxID=354 RepID=C1DP35_AZOVD|nr:hypothetical protein Avin_32290 [Azotobacter vinelandii DJ]AGK16401.1 hypothetical protein AvCA_32290 [Azotobacter vinelandii CA]AGK21181.1 hypothetical protein AvCA6_32290 [Azotobacter vinelandii CA6]
MQERQNFLDLLIEVVDVRRSRFNAVSINGPDVARPSPMSKRPSARTSNCRKSSVTFSDE